MNNFEAIKMLPFTLCNASKVIFPIKDTHIIIMTLDGGHLLTYPNNICKKITAIGGNANVCLAWLCFRVYLCLFSMVAFRVLSVFVRVCLTYIECRFVRDWKLYFFSPCKNHNHIMMYCASLIKSLSSDVVGKCHRPGIIKPYFVL
jgi:hypothetical protein